MNPERAGKAGSENRLNDYVARSAVPSARLPGSAIRDQQPLLRTRGICSNMNLSQRSTSGGRFRFGVMGLRQ
jgi:hypothetical protein